MDIWTQISRHYISHTYLRWQHLEVPSLWIGCPVEFYQSPISLWSELIEWWRTRHLLLRNLPRNTGVWWWSGSRGIKVVVVAGIKVVVGVWWWSGSGGIKVVVGGGGGIKVVAGGGGGGGIKVVVGGYKDGNGLGWGCDELMRCYVWVIK